MNRGTEAICGGPALDGPPDVRLALPMQDGMDDLCAHGGGLVECYSRVPNTRSQKMKDTPYLRSCRLK